MNENNNQNNKPEGGNGPQRNPQMMIIMTITAMAMLALIAFGSRMFNRSTSKEVTYNDFWAMVEKGQVESVEIDRSSQKITITPKGSTLETGIKYYTGYLDDDQLIERLDAAGVRYQGKIPDTNSTILELLLMYVLPIALMLIGLNFLMKRSGGPLSVGKSNAKMYVQQETGVTFADVAGEDEAKESLTEIVDFLHNPARYVQIGAKLPKGALLVGPPGTGKTLLAKAVAGEAKVPFFSLSGSDFVEMFVGVGASRVRDLFREAQKNAPCIIFIDEIDAIGKSRDSRFGGGNDEREQTLNQLLSEMDGFDSSKGVFILAATNRPDTLDKALLRPGRLDRRIIVERPDLKGRVEILKVHAKDVRMDETVDLENIALATSGAVGSDLANMINEAAIAAVKHGRQAVSQKDLFEAVEVVLVGKEKKDRVMNAEERRIVSYHEVGHALISAMQKNAEPVQKITIVPRTMGALGYVMQVPEEEKYLNTKKELEDRLVSLFGGRAAEELVFGSITTGASNDIEQATKLARAMVTQYGMSEAFGLMNLETVEDAYLSGRTVMNCADGTAEGVDEEVKRMLKAAYEQAKAMLRDNRDIMDKIAAFLIEKETITGKEFMELLNQALEERRLRAAEAIEVKFAPAAELEAEDALYAEDEEPAEAVTEAVIGTAQAAAEAAEEAGEAAGAAEAQTEEAVTGAPAEETAEPASAETDEASRV